MIKPLSSRAKANFTSQVETYRTRDGVGIGRRPQLFVNQGGANPGTLPTLPSAAYVTHRAAFVSYLGPLLVALGQPSGNTHYWTDLYDDLLAQDIALKGSIANLSQQ